MKQIVLESSPFFVLLCMLLAVGLAFLLYRMAHPWSKTWNRILFALRAILIFLILFLLLGPIIRQITNTVEKPLFVLLYDNSSSISETSDSLTIQKLLTGIDAVAAALIDQQYEIKKTNLTGEEIQIPVFSGTSTDLNDAIRKIANQHEGRKLAGVVLVSDGIYNTGASPLYGAYNFPVHTIGVGDTLQRTDVAIKNIAFNKLAYQGNKFPVRVEVVVKNLNSQSVRVTLKQRGTVLEQQTKTFSDDQLLVYDFQPLASDQGIQKLDIEVEVKPGEVNTRNNQGSVFIEVVEGRKKILLVAAAPHPDVKALREVVEKNSNYQFLLHVPGVTEQQTSELLPENIDLAIFHQSPDQRGVTRELFSKFARSKTSLLLVVGQQTDLRQLTTQNMPLSFRTIPRDYDDVTPVANPSFSSFTLSPEANSIMADYPPVSVHFGKINAPQSATSLLYQRVGSLATDNPLLVVDVQDTRKIGMMLGEGLWRWRLNEFDRTENTIAFDEVFGKLIQFLSTTDDKRKFKSYPIQQEFLDVEAVVFESQVYNDLYEPVYGNTIDLELTNEQGKRTRYSYITSPGNIRYQIGGLTEGVYRYQASTTLNTKKQEVRGEFAVVARQTELQNLTADFDLLRKLSVNTGGKFYTASQTELLKTELSKVEATGVIHSDETYNSLISLKWVFWLVIVFATSEWFARKFFGSY